MTSDRIRSPPVTWRSCGRRTPPDLETPVAIERSNIEAMVLRAFADRR